jgi:hypothetical protein
MTKVYTPQGNAVGVIANGQAQWSPFFCPVRTAGAVFGDARIVPSPGCLFTQGSAA